MPTVAAESCLWEGRHQGGVCHQGGVSPRWGLFPREGCGTREGSGPREGVCHQGGFVTKKLGAAPTMAVEQEGGRGVHRQGHTVQPVGGGLVSRHGGLAHRGWQLDLPNCQPQAGRPRGQRERSPCAH